MAGRNSLFLLCSAAMLTGCAPPPPEKSAPPPDLPTVPSRFDPTTVGTIQGHLTWAGPTSLIDSYRSPSSPLNILAGTTFHDWPNPHRAAIDPATRGIRGAVVFLRGVDPARARPWNLPPVQVAFRDCLLEVHQGYQTGHTGFVRRGDTFELVNHDAGFHSLRGEGADRFMLPCPDVEQPRPRRTRFPGIVELTSGNGQFWMHGYLFVVEHPYYTVTDDTGAFTLAQVPAGDYDLVTWLPDWHEAGHEFDADTWLLARLRFRPPVQRVVRVHVKSGETHAVIQVMSLVDFSE
jgi:hypothetical protein